MRFRFGLIGGEKRRVSIGCELLANPKLMFLDEPTTGLDSSNAAKVVDILADMAGSGITVIMSIHQPRSRFFSMINRMLMLSENGQVGVNSSGMHANRFVYVFMVLITTKDTV